MTESEYGYAVYSDGTTAPLDPPDFLIPEEDREYLIQRPGFTLWTKKTPTGNRHRGGTAMTKFKAGDRVRILVGGPHENRDRIATVGYIQHNGDVIIYFGDQDENEFVYSPSELELAPTRYKIWYIHQVGGKPFEREIPDPKTGWLILDTIYDLARFQFENHMIPDYANAGGIVFLDEDGDWIDYQEEE